MPQKLTPPQVKALQAKWLANPELFVTEVLGATPWQKQIEIIQSTFKYKTTAVKTCNAVGKSYIAARIVVTYLMLYPGSVVVTTAPTWRQVTDVLWREIRTAVKMTKFKLTEKEVTQAGLSLDTDWFAVGLSTKYPENFFGYHADNILVVVDEAGGVEEPIFKGVKAITPNVNARILYIGNPTSAGGTFWEAFDNMNLPINRFTISAFDTPNFTANNIKTTDDLLRLFTPQGEVSQAEWTERVNKVLKMPYPALIAPSVVFERYHEWGVDSPSWQALVMGEFPTQSENSLIPADLVTAAMNMGGVDESSGMTYAELSGWTIPNGPPEYGIDMARYGSDSTVVYPRRGGYVDDAIVWNKTSLTDSAHQIIKIIDPLDPNVRVNIDDTGNGGGTTDRLRELSSESVKSMMPMHRYQLAAFNFSSSPYSDKFHDITSELYWNLRDWFYKKRISLPMDKVLEGELINRQWRIMPSGKIKVESKDEYKKRTGGKSPDRADALALAFAGGIRQDYQPERAQESAAYVPKPITSGLQQRY